MADFDVTVIPSRTKVSGLRAVVYLGAGESMTDNAVLAAAARRTVPAGKHARLVVTIAGYVADGAAPQDARDIVTGL